MVGDTPDGGPGDGGYVSDLDALDGLLAPPEPEPGDAAGDEDDGGVRLPTFTVSNPLGTVTVSAHFDGRVARVELAPRVAEMTETELAEEIVVIAGLASQDAKSAQYATMLRGMREMGQDDHATREFLQRDLDLPTPEQAWAHRADVFATRYAGTHE